MPEDEGPLAPGAYHTLLTDLIDERLRAGANAPTTEPLDAAEAARRLADHLRDALHHALAALPTKERTAQQLALTNDLLRWLATRTTAEAAREQVLDPPRTLRLITGALLPNQTTPALPDVPLIDHDLLTNAPGEPSLAHALRTELETADRLDGAIAFIRWTGLRYLQPALEVLRRAGRPVRILTTTFTGSTERRALDWLCEHGVEVKVSYETRTTRLHAKSWLIHRDTGFSTAFVGSSNLSHAALVDGIEWNVRLAERSAPEVFGKLRATFESLWNDDSFERYEPARDGERFDRAVQSTRGGTIVSTLSGIAVHPWPYQCQMLEALVVDRARHGRRRSLIVAPTGTGKTVVAALDYRALRRGMRGIDVGQDPSLLFVAHREQILDQAQRTFRDVLQRGDFGERFVGGDTPKQWRHVFASIQSLHHLDTARLEPERFDIVYVDAFHHAEAPTYQRLLQHLRPKLLVGMTATPERTDGSNVRDRYFDGHYAFEMRLWDALDQQLLAPFHYFGVADGTDLSSLEWQRGGYRTVDLEQRYVIHDGNDARTAKVITALRERIADPRRMRAIGFCVSIAHARYMAERFAEAHIPARVIDAETASETRRQILDDLRARHCNVVFAVDVLSEGVDIPEVDTVLLLRPTESATVFLQQLGRGLRLCRDKDVCTVLDFIGQQHRKFRFDLRLRAMTGRSRGELTRDAAQGFPILPKGCQIQLDRQAERHILDNLKAVTGVTSAQLAAELRQLERDGGPVSLGDFLSHSLCELEDILRLKEGWTALRRKAGVAVAAPGPREEEIARSIAARFGTIDDPERIDMLRRLASDEDLPADARSQTLAAMLGFVLFDDGKAPRSVAAVRSTLEQEPAIRRTLLELADVLDERASVLTKRLDLWSDVPLHLHATYTRSEVLVALGDRCLGDKTAMREGVRYLAARKTDLLFVTLDKSGGHYSPTTRYRDYAIARDLFHWESQSFTTRRSPTGRRYLDGSSHVLLFVRAREKDARGRTHGFVCLGPVVRVSDRGERPIQITWRLKTPMPEHLLRLARAAAI
jgi:superfamily II DNA or RNA helicase/HKD family nuclease